MFRLFIMIGEDWHKIREYIYATMAEVMSRVKTCELCINDPWFYQVWEPGTNDRLHK